MTNEELEIKRDRLRYIKNTTSANFALIAIVLDVLYFVSVYQSDVGTWYYQMLIGASIVYNLLFMLTVFLCEEGVKNYKKPYSFVLIAVGIGQLVRIFILPTMAHNATILVGGVETQVMGNGQFISLVIFLGLSAACLFASAIVNIKKCGELEAHLKSINAAA